MPITFSAEDMEKLRRLSGRMGIFQTAFTTWYVGVNSTNSPNAQAYSDARNYLSLFDAEKVELRMHIENLERERERESNCFTLSDSNKTAFEIIFETLPPVLDRLGARVTSEFIDPKNSGITLEKLAGVRHALGHKLKDIRETLKETLELYKSKLPAQEKLDLERRVQTVAAGCGL